MKIVKYMQAQIQKWGNSLGVRIPKAFIKKLHLKAGSNIIIEATEGSLVLSKTESELDRFLNNINKTNRHHEAFTEDKAIGNESW